DDRGHQGGRDHGHHHDLRSRRAAALLRGAGAGVRTCWCGGEAAGWGRGVTAFEAACDDVDKLNITTSAVRTATVLGFGRAEIVAMIQTMQRTHFYKSMPPGRAPRALTPARAARCRSGHRYARPCRLPACRPAPRRSAAAACRPVRSFRPRDSSSDPGRLR